MVQQYIKSRVYFLVGVKTSKSLIFIDHVPIKRTICSRASTRTDIKFNFHYENKYFFLISKLYTRLVLIPLLSCFQFFFSDKHAEGFAKTISYCW